MSDPVSATDVPAPSSANRLDGPDVVLYPEQVAAGRGTYSLDDAGFVDDLVTEGVTARPYHDLLHSDWSGERDPLVLTLILGIASPAGWDAVKLLFGRRSGGRVDATVGFRHGDETRWVRAEGDGSGVAEALDRVNPWKTAL
jgi:hypothetical protein